MRLRQIIIEKVRNAIYESTGVVEEVDDFATTIHWNDHHEIWNGDVFEGILYIENNPNTAYSFAGVLNYDKIDIWFEVVYLQKRKINSTTTDLIKNGKYL